MAGQRVPGVMGEDPPMAGEVTDGGEALKDSRFSPPGPVGEDDSDVIPLDVTRNIVKVVKDWEPPAPTKSDIVVNGKTLEDVAKELNKREEWGQGGGFIRNDAVPPGNNTDVTVKLHANLVLRMPRWTGFETASPAAKAEWNRMIAKLKIHEDRHVAIAIEEADTLAAALVGREINELARMVTAANKSMDDRQKEMDGTCDHGQTEHVPFGDVFLDTSIV
jgi:hypothetical protein